MSDRDGLTGRLAAVRRRIEAVAGGRPVTVVAVTKGFGPEAVRDAVAAGLLDCGENQAQSLLAKMESAPDAVRWHFLGPVQRNKVKALAPVVTLWHAVDREAAGAEIARHRPGAEVLVQVNLSGDEHRPGCTWGEGPMLVRRLGELGLVVNGVMGVAPRDPHAARPLFRRLAELAASEGLADVSMGMSGDYEIAVEEGATVVRIGTALFGARPEPA